MGRSARLLFNLSDVIYATLVKFFVGFYTSLVFLLKPLHILLMLVSTGIELSDLESQIMKRFLYYPNQK